MMDIALHLWAVALFGAAIAGFVWFLRKMNLVSKEAYEGKETKGIRMAKYVVLAIVLIALLSFAYLALFSY